MGRHDEEYDGDYDERYGDGYVHELHYDAGKKNTAWMEGGEGMVTPGFTFLKPELTLTAHFSFPGLV